MDKESLNNRLKELDSTIEAKKTLFLQTQQYLQMLEGAKLECLEWLKKIDGSNKEEIDPT